MYPYGTWFGYGWFLHVETLQQVGKPAAEYKFETTTQYKLEIPSRVYSNSKIQRSQQNGVDYL